MTRKELKEIQMSDVSRPDELVTMIQGVGRPDTGGGGVENDYSSHASHQAERVRVWGF
jgi:hypothetical protein